MYEGQRYKHSTRQTSFGVKISTLLVPSGLKKQRHQPKREYLTGLGKSLQLRHLARGSSSTFHTSQLPLFLFPIDKPKQSQHGERAKSKEYKISKAHTPTCKGTPGASQNLNLTRESLRRTTLKTKDIQFSKCVPQNHPSVWV